jgi:hypothetical protein
MKNIKKITTKVTTKQTKAREILAAAGVKNARCKTLAY